MHCMSLSPEEALHRICLLPNPFHNVLNKIWFKLTKHVLY